MKTFNIRFRSSERLKDFIYKNQIVDSSDILIQIFTSYKDIEKIKDFTSVLTDLLPSSNIIGTSTDGEIIDGRVLTDNTIISITVFDHTTVESVILQDLAFNSFQSGKDLAKKLLKDNTKAMIFFLSCPDIDGSIFLKGARSVKKDIVISGGFSADGGKFDGGVVFDNSVITKQGVVGISLSSDNLQVSNRYSSGWEPIGKEFKITKSKECRVFRVDKMTIYDLYYKYLGESIAKKLPLSALQFPFVLNDEKNGGFIARSIRLDTKDESFIFSSKMQQGDNLQIAFGDSDKMLYQTQNMIKDLYKNESVETLFIYSSGGRRRFLKSASFAEIESFNSLGSNCGFFGFGEFYSNKDESIFLNQSICVLSLSEREHKLSTDIHFKTDYKKIDSNFEVTKALANIAQVSSQELQELNQKLGLRIQEEVKKNRDKDSIMIHNSKLAQMGEMMSMIAHQWRQPLSAISSTSTGLHVKIELDRYEEEYFLSALTKIEDYVKHLSDTIDDFANFFKPSKKKELTTLKEMIDKALFIISPSFSKNSIEVGIDFHADVKFETYKNEIVQVLINLFKNAENILIKREVKNPKISIKTYERDDKKFIEILDNGGGIDEGIINDIFNSYFTTNDTQNSTGLGLYMSKFIVEKSCGGKLSLTNSDKGAKFTIVLD